MLQNDPFPKLSAKAMEIRHLLAAVIHFSSAWLANPIIARFQKLLQLSHGLDEIVFSNKTFVLSMLERQALKEGTFKYNQALTRLARFFHERGLPFCNYTVINHYLCHIGLEASRTGVNPRLAFCFEGEDFMRVVKSLCMGSSRGLESALLIDKAIPKYLRGLDYLLKQA